MRLLQDQQRTLSWLIATPLLATWAMLSPLPALELLGLALYGPAPSAVAITGKILFAATGIAGVFGMVLAAMMLLQAPAKDALLRQIRGRVGLAAVYAATWLGGYFALETSGL